MSFKISLLISLLCISTAAFSELEFKPLSKNYVSTAASFTNCGNGAPDPGEECDDGNTTDCDGCSASCQVEPPDAICPPLNCDVPAPCFEFENILIDGSFELDDGAWTIDGFIAGICDELCTGGSNLALEGTHWLWMGGTLDNPDSGTAIQALVIPAEAETIVFWVLSAATNCGDSSMVLSIDNTALWTFEDLGQGECDTVAPFNYELVSLDISDYADGALHEIKISGDYVPAGGGQNANWFFDAFSIEIAVNDCSDDDGDLVANARDNCILIPNSCQEDYDGDQFGNVCDADLNGDCATNFMDLSSFSNEFLTMGDDIAADFNSDGIVNFIDLAIFADLFGLPPGPSALTSCTIR